MLKTVAIELRLTHPRAVLAALHPGTKSVLLRPFRGEMIGRDPAQAAAEMLAVPDGLRVEDTGQRLPR